MYSVKKLNQLKANNNLAFAVNPDNFEIVVSNSGHATILRDYSKLDFCQGGWVNIKQKKLIFNCGSLADVKDKPGVKNALQDFLGLYFEYSR